MPLAAGARLGPYEILAPIGAGGMGEVYRARDTKLDRDVAIKVLPAALAQDPERLARFEREAKVLASLNHPNIAQIYGIEDRALIMELIDGETLHGPLSLDTALNYAKQIVDALEAAHEKNIIHRDLKPANIMITPTGVVKVLDFGLAAVAQSSDPSNPANSPTLTISPTRAGTILGTAGYMSPEQARGKAVDRRADIWAFGCVLFEMLTGEQAFTGETITDILAAVVKTEPDLTRVPLKVRRLLRRCLEKDPKKRLRDIGDVWELLHTEGSPAQTARLSYNKAGWIVAALMTLAFAALALLHFRQTPPSANTLRYTIAPPENSTVHSFAVSPDGRLLAIAASVNGKQQLWLRPLDGLQAQPLPTTDDATFPFWSPDSRYIAFFAQDKLKKVAVSGGQAESLCNAANGRGGSWNHNDVILFSPSGASPQGIERVAANGGMPSDVFKTKGLYRYPSFLPDGRHFLYTNVLSTDKSDGIYVASLDGKENRRILPDVSLAQFAPSVPANRTGHLFFIRENNLMALPFDARNTSASGGVLPVAESVSTNVAGSAGFALLTVSENGVLLYSSGNLGGGVSQLVWFDRTGKPPVPVGAPGLVLTPALSPDEKVVAYTRLNSNSDFDIWLWDLGRATETLFATGALIPSWSPKGDRIVFTSYRGKGGPVIYQKASSGSGQKELLLPSTTSDVPTQWSRNGRFIVYEHADPKTKSDLWVLPVQPGPSVSSGSAKPMPFLQAESEVRMGQLSPDNRWMAYSSDESGQREVYVCPFPSGDREVKISTAGGDQPRWRGDGKELFYIAASGKMTAVPMQLMPGAPPRLEPGVPMPLFDAHTFSSGNFARMLEYDVTADGKRFLVASTGGTGAASPPLTALVNWNAGLKK